MKKKLFFTLTIFLALIISPVFAKEAVRSSQKLIVDGKNVDAIYYNIDGYNYFMLRDVAKNLKDTDAKFSVDYDEVNRRVVVKKGENYEEGEISLDILERADAKISDQKVYVDEGAEDIEGYLINNLNYFKLRDLGKALNFSVDYDNSLRAIIIDTSKSYTENSEKAVQNNEYDGTLVNLDYDTAMKYVAPNGGYLNLPKGIMVTVKNDVVQKIENVSGKTKIPSDGYVIYETETSIEDTGGIYTKGNIMAVLISAPNPNLPNSMRNGIQENYVLAFSVAGDPYYEVIPEVIYENLDDEKVKNAIDIHLADPKAVFDKVSQGGKLGSGYWLLSDFKNLDEKKEAMIAYALDLRGTPYYEVDCSGLVYSSMVLAGIDPGNPFFVTETVAQSSGLKEIPIKDIKRGDILNTTSSEGGHVMIYLGGNKVVESVPKGGVKIGNLRTNGYKAYRIIEY